jgi:hypothetical protein
MVYWQLGSRTLGYGMLEEGISCDAIGHLGVPPPTGRPPLYGLRLHGRRYTTAATRPPQHGRRNTATTVRSTNVVKQDNDDCNLHANKMN